MLPASRAVTSAASRLRDCLQGWASGWKVTVCGEAHRSALGTRVVALEYPAKRAGDCEASRVTHAA